ncbi:hypothetical protein TRVL_01628 [Trypanosoma vivax]|uniref:SKI-interacting protein SKIP SNW domain-containing protein n=1 Tax=Trypanosoma vivax (strain Y486) TaxID=1055687 RepID=G0U290_TRYVY|nr:hypothetical protein TRVL_01628 [Trypanosoma vivax]CCC50393.1 conserved hypothetical protein [Trypanosoma vivax Y486]
MRSVSEDGGAFAECYYAQYPLGMGKGPLPFSLSALAVSSVHAGDALANISQRNERCDTAGQESDSRGLELTTEATREAMEVLLECRQREEEDFSGRKIRRASRKKPVLEISLSDEAGVQGVHDPAPIVRSPTRAARSLVDTVTVGGSNSGKDETSGTMVVPFSVSNWKNKRKLVIPLEQRMAQHSDVQAAGGGRIGEHVMQLAMAMQRARKEVEAEQLARDRARQEEEERRQAEKEAEATRHAKEILEKTAEDIHQSTVGRRKETREERLERIRLERELREQEKQQEMRQRRLTKAATRLGMSLEALEADEELLKTVNNSDATYALVNTHNPNFIHPPSGRTSVMEHGQSSVDQVPSLYTDDADVGTRPPGASALRKGVFGSAVISNEGIRREMEALEKLEKQQTEPKDGLRLTDDSVHSSEEEEEDGLGMDRLMKRIKKKPRL